MCRKGTFPSTHTWVIKGRHLLCECPLSIYAITETHEEALFLLNRWKGMDLCDGCNVSLRIKKSHIIRHNLKDPKKLALQFKLHYHSRFHSFTGESCLRPTGGCSREETLRSETHRLEIKSNHFYPEGILVKIGAESVPYFPIERLNFNTPCTCGACMLIEQILKNLIGY